MEGPVVTELVDLADVVQNTAGEKKIPPEQWVVLNDHVAQMT